MTKLSPEACIILDDARALIARPYGWGKGFFHHKTKKRDMFCAVGACRESAAKRGFFNSNLQEAVGALAKTVSPGDRRKGFPQGIVTSFNDNEQTKKTDVLNVFDKCIEKNC